VVGKDASATGNVLLSRTEDVRPGVAARFVVYPRGYYKKGVPVKLDRNGFAFTFSHDSYKFTGTPMATYSSVMMAKGVDETVTPPDALVSFSKAVDSGFLTLYPTSGGGAHITLNYFLADGKGSGRIAGNLLFVRDGKTDGKLSGSIRLAVAGQARRSPGRENG
jgi:hypothetical protein